MAKKKGATVDLDLLLTKDKISNIPTEELKVIKEKGDNKRLPSVTGRTIANQLFKNLGEGKWIDTKGMNEDQKESVMRTMRRELLRWAKHEGHAELRVRIKEQQERFGIYYDTRKKKNGKETSGKGKK